MPICSIPLAVQQRRKPNFRGGRLPSYPRLARRPRERQGPAPWPSKAAEIAAWVQWRLSQDFSRHASLDTVVTQYEDNRADHSGQVAQALDSILG